VAHLLVCYCIVLEFDRVFVSRKREKQLPINVKIQPLCTRFLLGAAPTCHNQCNGYFFETGHVYTSHQPLSDFAFLFWVFFWSSV
jgi:hypothetical protein